MKGFVILILFSAFLLNAQNKGTITGKVVDGFTKQPVPGVNILIEDTDFGAASDVNGEFTIKGLDPGTYILRASAIAYKTQYKNNVVVSSGRPADVLFEMVESYVELEGVTVTSDYFNNTPTEVNSVTNFSYEEIRRSPGGFEDVVRALSILPGVARQSAGRNDLVVRGGAPSENLYLVDGFVVPNINHFGNQGATGGPLSYINLDFVQETEFSSGGFSALYGDKLSSVLRIDLRNGRTDRIGGKATVSASQFGLNVEGPVSSTGSFIFSARRSYLDFIFKAAGFGFVPEYWDVMTKYNTKFDNANQLSFLFIGAFDRVNFNNDTKDNLYDNSRVLGSNQNQYLAGLSYRHFYKDALLTLSLSRNMTDYDSYQNDVNLQPVFRNKSLEAENEIKADLVYKLSAGNELNAGVSGKLIKFRTDILLPLFVTTFGDTLLINNLNTAENYTKLSSYIQYSSLLSNSFRINAGLRGDFFNGIHDEFYVSPRFSAAYLMTDEMTLNFSTGIYYQSPSYIWLAAENQNRKLKAVKVNQFILGAEYKFREDVRFKVEGFIKDYLDYPASTLRSYLVLSNTGAGFGGSDDNFASFGLDPLVSAGKGNVKGVEVSLQKKSSGNSYYGLVSLTYSKSDFTALDGVSRSGVFDQNLLANLVGGYIFSDKWEANFKFRLATGRPYTPFNINGTQSVSSYNSKRFTSSHSLDVRVDRRWNFDGWNLIAYIDIQNIYNRQNISNIRWDYQENKPEDSRDIGLLPSIGVSVEF